MESVGDRLTAVRDPRIAELGRRGQAAAAAAAALAVVEPESAAPQDEAEREGGDGELALASLRLVDPHRACIETNLTRRGFWVAVAGGVRQLSLPLDGEDRFGTFTVEPGPRGALTVLELEVVTWLCSRWRELGNPHQRRIPLSLSQLASDFGWPGGGSHLRRLTVALDRLRQASITAEVWAPGEHEPRLRRHFGLVGEWQAGSPDAEGQLRRRGWVEIGSWLLEQLRGEHLTFLDWPTLREFERPIAKRLYALLEAERFSDGPEKRWPVDDALFVTLGMGRGNPRQARQRLGEAAAEVEGLVARYSKVAVLPRERGRGHLLIARRRSR
jgi:hypothetical protein